MRYIHKDIKPELSKIWIKLMCIGTPSSLKLAELPPNNPRLDGSNASKNSSLLVNSKFWKILLSITKLWSMYIIKKDIDAKKIILKMGLILLDKRKIIKKLLRIKNIADRDPVSKIP